MMAHGDPGCPPQRRLGEIAFWGVERMDGDYEARIIKVCKWTGLQVISRHILWRRGQNKISFLFRLLKNYRMIAALPQTTGIVRNGIFGWYP